MAARIAPQKNQELVVEAIARLKASGTLLSVASPVAGRVSSRAYDRRVRAAMEPLGLGDRGAVSRPGPRHAVALRGGGCRADAVADRAFLIAALEALACGSRC